MASCKDCINFDVCLERGDIAPKELLDGAEQDCDFFKNKADFVEVVRCKDCRNRYEKNWAKCTGRRPDDFCSDGKRKEGAE